MTIPGDGHGSFSGVASPEGTKRGASAETMDSGKVSMSRQDAVGHSSTNQSQKRTSQQSGASGGAAVRRSGGLGRLLGLQRLNQRLTLARSVFASFTLSRDSQKAWSPGDLERSLYEGQHHDQDPSDILNIQELFHGGEMDEKGPESESYFSFIWRFHLSPAARMVELIRLFTVVGTCIVAPLSFILSGDWTSPELVPGGRALLAFDCTMDVVYAICLVLRLRISFLHPITKKEVFDAEMIRRYFFQSLIWWLQVVSSFSYLWLGLGATLLLNNLKIIRVGPLLRAPDALWRWEDNIIVRLGRPVVLLVLGAHWTACLLFTVGGFRQELINREEEFETNFDMGYGISGKVSGGVSLYFMAFVEALYMLTGSLDNPLGDGGPRNKDFGSLLMVSIFGPLGCVVVALFISAIMREQQRAFALESKHEENKAFMERALQILQIPPELQQRVLSMHLFQKFEHDVEAFNSLFEKKNLSKALENTLLVYLYRETVVCSPHFRNKDPNYIIAVVNVLEDQVFLPGDYVARKGEVATSMYFVSRGWLTILVPDHEDENNVEKAKPIPQRLGVGDQFGEIALVKDTVRTAWVRADTYVIVSALPSSSIRHVWDFYPEERSELLRTVERHAERDRKRRVKQRWEKGLGGATVTPWKVRGTPINESSQTQGSLQSGKTVRFDASDSESPRSFAASTSKSVDLSESSREMVESGRRLQAIESRMDELLRRQSSLERSISESLKRREEENATLAAMQRGWREDMARVSLLGPEEWNERSLRPPQERKVKRKHRSKVPKPCVDLTALAKIEVCPDPALEGAVPVYKATLQAPMPEAEENESVILQLNFPDGEHGATNGSLGAGDAQRL